MFLIDDILLAPMKGLLAICQKVHDAAEQELESQEQAIVATLAELHQLLESGQIGDEDFNVRETALLDQLEAVQSARNPQTEPDQQQQEQED